MVNLVVFPVSHQGQRNGSRAPVPPVPALDIIWSTEMKLASCRCGALTAECEGEPDRITVGGCLAARSRADGADGTDAQYHSHQLVFSGETATTARTTVSGHLVVNHFCPRCGATVWSFNESQPSLLTIPIGAFADPVVTPAACPRRAGVDLWI
jgi:hypothetical protein